MALTRNMSKSATPSEKAGAITPTALLGRKSMKQLTFSEYRSGAPCPVCGRDDFKSDHTMRIHASATHDVQRPKAWAVCDWCDKLLNRKPTAINERNFCNRDCRAQWQSENVRGSDSNLWDGGKVTTECDQCGDELIRNPSDVERGRDFCDSQCQAEWQKRAFSGEGNPRWNGGITFYKKIRALIDDIPWKTVRREVREESDRTCQMCGTHESNLQRKLDVHHIIPLLAGGTNGMWNLIALCMSCHKKAEDKTEAFAEDYLSI